jgi:hypothetical protein
MSSMVFIFDVLSTDLEIGYGSSLSLVLWTPEKKSDFYRRFQRRPTYLVPETVLRLCLVALDEWLLQ